jgi:hypothetical protein
MTILFTWETLDVIHVLRIVLPSSQKAKFDASTAIFWSLRLDLVLIYCSSCWSSRKHSVKKETRDLAINYRKISTNSDQNFMRNWSLMFFSCNSWTVAKAAFRTLEYTIELYSSQRDINQSNIFGYFVEEKNKILEDQLANAY